mmetsp:Transcript_24521/g.33582  ORF Transcript_24521/g.33582 Transcript_24521/m.33582 type:complete len:86 (+) Transcript_24521:1429-1686(+)
MHQVDASAIKRRRRNRKDAALEKGAASRAVMQGDHKRKNIQEADAAVEKGVARRAVMQGDHKRKNIQEMARQADAEERKFDGHDR